MQQPTMRRSRPVTLFLCAVLMLLGGLTMPHVSSAQDTPLIHACVDARGALRIVAPTTTCSAKETRLTWPAEPPDPPEPVTFYQRASAPQPVVDGTVATAIALCDDPADTAVGGGFRTERLLINAFIYHVITSVSCRASGLCGSAGGEDGWLVMAKGNMTPTEGVTVTASVICATP